VRRGGSGAPGLLLLHGLGATSQVWDGFAARIGSRAWIAVDLPGHGGSPPLAHYTFEAVADAVAPLIDPGGVIILGHSFGGVVALHLANRPGVRAVVGLGIKVAWSEDDLAQASELAARPARVLPTRADAIARHLRLAGLTGLADPADPALDDAVSEVEGGWRTAFDPRAYGIGDPAVAELVMASSAPVVLARGERDPMVSTGQLLAVAPDPVVLPGLGHNAHVEDPGAVLPLLEQAESRRKPTSFVSRDLPRRSR